MAWSRYACDCGPPSVACTSKRTLQASYENDIFFNIESWTPQRISRDDLQQVIWNEDSKGFSKAFARFVQIISDKTASSLKCSTLLAYPVLAILFGFFNAYRRWIVQSRYLLAFLSAEWPPGVSHYTTFLQTFPTIHLSRRLEPHLPLLRAPVGHVH